ncbi:MAG: EAL domain-containing protein [Gammaproteobacteria bacterium]|nr:EAL domain-containing protein [Gammaproteobacteria bacterium]
MSDSDDSLLLNVAVMEAANILMVDDEPLNMEVLQVHLEAEGYSNFTCISDSTKAFEQINNQRPDVVLLDLVMPEVTGFDILFEMRADPELKYIPVIVLTSSDDAATKLKALHLGATDFLAKPVDESELALRMRNTLSVRAYQRQMLYVDSLTNLPNRLYLQKIVQSALNSSDSRCSEAAAVLVNIDRFKMINDSLGPERGDEVLWKFSQRLVAAFGITQAMATVYLAVQGEGCVAARVGGDQFVIMLSNATSRDELTERIVQFLESMKTPVVVDGQDIYLSASIGISSLTSSTESFEELLNDAESAMLYARRNPAIGYAFYSDSMNEKARELMSIGNGLRTAVQNDELFLVYQPKVDTATNTITGAEALIRWNHPELGLVPPVHFISVAEDSGMIVGIGEWVMRQACSQAALWQAYSAACFKIAVNVSIRQLHEPNFVAFVDSVLSESGLPPECLILELTENMVMDNAEANIKKLKSLKALGVGISIDDFGTGYSSLAYLQKFSLDQLKIDRSFIWEIERANDKHPIVKAVVSLAHDLGMTVVAEGVETAQQLAHIHSVGCEEYQGYLCSKPVLADEFETLLLDSIKRSA